MQRNHNKSVACGGEKTKQHIAWIDIVKAISILMVIDVHMETGVLIPTGGMYHLIPFFFLPGAVKGLTEGRHTVPLREIQRRKFVQIMLPYFFLSILNILLRVGITTLQEGSMNLQSAKTLLLSTLTLQGIGTLWFLPVLFVSSVAYEICVSRKVNKKLQGFFSVPAFAIIAYLAKALETKGLCGEANIGVETAEGIASGFITLLLLSGMAISLMSLGYGISDWIGRLFTIHQRKYGNLAIVILMCIVSISCCNALKSDFSANLRYASVGNPLTFVGASLCGIVFVCCLGYLLSLVPWLSRILSWFGTNSLILMTTHKELYVTYAVPLVIVRAFNALNIDNDLFIRLSCFVAVIAIEILIVYIVNSSKLRRIYRWKQ